jgi:iron complex transport system substrate-binding protein
MKRLTLLLISCVLCISCSRFHNAPNASADARYVVISPIYNEIVWALGAQDKVVGIDLSTTYSPEVKNVQTVGYHRALSAEGILSLHPTGDVEWGRVRFGVVFCSRWCASRKRQSL